MEVCTQCSGLVIGEPHDGMCPRCYRKRANKNAAYWAWVADEARIPGSVMDAKKTIRQARDLAAHYALKAQQEATCAAL